MRYTLDLTATDIERLLFQLRARHRMITSHDEWIEDMIARLVQLRPPPPTLAEFAKMTDDERAQEAARQLVHGLRV